MKVLSIIEPYATLICEKKKHIETRSWKTNYRGELYIHSSISEIPNKWKDNKDVMNLVDNKSFNYGNIICKCNLVDCVYMDNDFIDDLKINNYQEYICGDYKIGRYAWILEDIEVLSIPINAKGQLNIWNYYNEKEVMSLMEEINYGWVDKNNISHSNVDDSFSDNYLLQAPKDLINSKVGVCWDQVELERYYFKSNNWNIKTFFIVHYDNANCPTHTFLTYEKNNKYFWFEHSWEIYKGIHEFDSINDLLIDVKEKFIKNELNNCFNNRNLCIYEYKKPKYHISVIDFYHHCENGKNWIV